MPQNFSCVYVVVFGDDVEKARIPADQATNLLAALDFLAKQFDWPMADGHITEIPGLIALELNFEQVDISQGFAAMANTTVVPDNVIDIVLA